MQTRYFINKPLQTVDDVPKDAVVNHSPGPNLDYISATHEMKPECDCKVCQQFFTKG